MAMSNSTSVTLGRFTIAMNAAADSHCTTAQLTICSIPNRARAIAAMLVHAQSCKTLFDKGDRSGLRSELSQASKYRFIIEQIDREPAEARILEVGCSRGHLTSIFILDRRRITGVDVSQKAVAAARAAFGDHFVLAGDPSIGARAPYDVIFHVGTIGCVADPVGMTRQWLDLLKPGGRLLFNAPNRDGCTLRGQLWFELRTATRPCDTISTRISGAIALMMPR